MVVPMDVQYADVQDPEPVSLSAVVTQDVDSPEACTK
jgi:hypothetical protein